MKDYDNKYIADNLRRYKRESRLTAVQLANESGVSVDTITHLLGGHNQNPSVTTLLKLSHVLGIPLQAFLEKK